MALWMDTLLWNGVESTPGLRRPGRAEVTEGGEAGTNQHHVS